MAIKTQKVSCARVGWSHALKSFHADFTGRIRHETSYYQRNFPILDTCKDHFGCLVSRGAGEVARICVTNMAYGLLVWVLCDPEKFFGLRAQVSWIFTSGINKSPHIKPGHILAIKACDRCYTPGPFDDLTF